MITIDKITLAVNEMDPAVEFYSAILDVHSREVGTNMLNTFAHVLIGFLCFLMAVPVAGQQTVVQRQEMFEKRIFRITETHFPCINGEMQTDGVKWGYHEYDSRGNHVVNGRFSAGGGTDAGQPMYLRIYDNENRPIKRIWYCNRTKENPAGDICLVFKNYKLDRFGNVVEENGYDPDGKFVARVSFKRDSEGRPLERTDFVVNDKQNQKRYIYRYNAEGHPREKTVFNFSGALIEKTTTQYQYDERQNVIAQTDYDQKGKMLRRSVHRYDLRDLKIETIDYNPTNQPVRIKRFSYQFYCKTVCTLGRGFPRCRQRRCFVLRR